MFAWFKRIFFGTLRFLWGIIKEVISGINEQALAAIMAIALNAVTELAAIDMSNEDRRKEAFKRIGDYAKEKGLEVRDSLVNLAIEIALQKFKKDRGI